MSTSAFKGSDKVGIYCFGNYWSCKLLTAPIPKLLAIAQAVAVNSCSILYDIFSLILSRNSIRGKHYFAVDIPPMCKLLFLYLSWAPETFSFC